jgi:hypothetical protein
MEVEDSNVNLVELPIEILITIITFAASNEASQLLPLRLVNTLFNMCVVKHLLKQSVPLPCKVMLNTSHSALISIPIWRLKLTLPDLPLKGVYCNTEVITHLNLPGMYVLKELLLEAPSHKLLHISAPVLADKVGTQLTKVSFFKCNFVVPPDILPTVKEVHLLSCTSLGVNPLGAVQSYEIPVHNLGGCFTVKIYDTVVSRVNALRSVDRLSLKRCPEDTVIDVSSLSAVKKLTLYMNHCVTGWKKYCGTGQLTLALFHHGRLNEVCTQALSQLQRLRLLYLSEGFVDLQPLLPIPDVELHYWTKELRGEAKVFLEARIAAAHTTMINMSDMDIHVEDNQRYSALTNLAVIINKNFRRLPMVAVHWGIIFNNQWPKEDLDREALTGICSTVAAFRNYPGIEWVPTTNLFGVQYEQLLKSGDEASIAEDWVQLTTLRVTLSGNEEILMLFMDTKQTPSWLLFRNFFALVATTKETMLFYPDPCFVWYKKGLQFHHSVCIFIRDSKWSGRAVSGTRPGPTYDSRGVVWTFHRASKS